jgi:CRP/FNR family transcriptional regulator
MTDVNATQGHPVEDLGQTLRRLFPDIHEPEARAAILEAGHLHELKAGDIWMDIGGYIKMIPLVLAGALKLIREDDEGHEMLLYFVGPGETCALSLTCCMSEARSTVRVVAEEDTVLLALPIRKMDEWTDHFRSWKSFVLLTYQRRFEELLRTVDSIAFQKLDTRLLDLLHERARKSGTQVIASTHQELANELNSSREVISRLLKALEKDGVLKLGRQRIELIEVR